MSEPLPVVTLAGLCDGAALELFQSEFDKVLRNIADPNTEATDVRKVTVVIALQPDDEREVGEVNVKVTSKLAGVKGARTRVYFGRHKGELVATEFNPKQQGLFDEKPELRAVGRKGGA